MQTLRAVILPAVLGGAVVAVSFLVFGHVGREAQTTTVVQQAPASTAGLRTAGQTRSTGPTPNEIYRRTAAGVVFVSAEVVQQSGSPFDVAPQGAEATGSGFVIDRSGRILTNYHLVAGASRVAVSFVDKKTVNARIVGTDASKDIALLKIDPKAHPLDPLALGQSTSVRVGDPVLALGNPFGFDRTLTSGIVSAMQRQIEAPNGFSIDNVIQTDAAINPGNSGGPLLDAGGLVIGINSQIAAGGSGGATGIGFAVPIDTARDDLKELETTGRVERAWLGITGATVDAGAGRSGVLVEDVAAGSPAARAGLRGAGGAGAAPASADVITRLGGRRLASIGDLTKVVAARRPGDRLSLEFMRGHRARTVTVRLGRQPARMPG